MLQITIKVIASNLVCELPRYKSEAWNPDCGRARRVFFGDKAIDYLDREYRFNQQHIRPGRWPEKLYLWEDTDSKWDPRHARDDAEAFPPCLAWSYTRNGFVPIQSEEYLAGIP